MGNIFGSAFSGVTILHCIGRQLLEAGTEGFPQRLLGNYQIQKMIEIMCSGKIPPVLRECPFEKFFHALLGMKTYRIVVGIFSGTYFTPGGG